MTVVVVAEQRLFADAMAAFLDGHDDIDVVGTALSVDDALATATSLRPDVIITSARLPDSNGADLILRLRKTLHAARVIMVTALDEEEEEILVAALDAGCFGFVPTSASVSDVVTAARTAISGEALIPPVLSARALRGILVGHGRRRTHLSAIELEILGLFPEGLPNRAIGEKLGLSERSVRNHVQSILTKLESRSKLQGLATAARRGIIHLTLR